jgi:hypothetical protein
MFNLSAMDPGSNGTSLSSEWSEAMLCEIFSHCPAFLTNQSEFASYMKFVMLNSLLPMPSKP